MRIVLERAASRVQEASRHPEVNQERTTAFEPHNQILAAPIERRYALAFELGRDLQRFVGPHEPVVVDLDALEGASDESRLEPESDAFDLGQLWHRSSLAVCRRGGP